MGAVSHPPLPLQSARPAKHNGVSDMGTQDLKQVLVVTHTEDVTGLLSELDKAIDARGGRMLRWNTDEFPVENQVTFFQDEHGEQLRFWLGGASHTIGAHDAIFYRRAKWGAKLPKSMDRQFLRASLDETIALSRGVLQAAPCFVMDPPARVRTNENKPYQQAVARKVGLVTPRTIMTNHPEEARAFLGSCSNGAVVKMLASFAIYDEQGREQVVFTTKFRPELLEKLDQLRFCPMVFQEHIPKKLELRITVVGQRFFTAAVDSQAMEGAETDWRERGLALVNAWQLHTLPAEIEEKLRAYMQVMGVQYSAIDMIVEPSCRYVFLEANPVGECFWLQHYEPHFPLADALADVLLDVPGARRKVS